MRVRSVRGDADRRTQEELGAYAFVRCRKRYAFSYHSGVATEPVLKLLVYAALSY